MAEESASFWSTLPGVLTAVAAVITALTGMVVAFRVAEDPGQRPPTEVDGGAQPSESVSTPPERPPARPDPNAAQELLEHVRTEVGSDCEENPTSLARWGTIAARRCVINEEDVTVYYRLIDTDTTFECRWRWRGAWCG